MIFRWKQWRGNGFDIRSGWVIQFIFLDLVKTTEFGQGGEKFAGGAGFRDKYRTNVLVESVQLGKK